MSLIRWLQLGLAIAGLVLSSASKTIHGFLVFAFVLALIYEVVSVIGWVIGREVFSGRGQVIAEIVVAIVLLIAAIVVTINGVGDIINVLALVCAFVLPALLIITAYTG
jgi:hypothetical protein